MIQRKNGKNTLIDIFLIIIITVLIGTLLIVMCGAKPAAAYNLFLYRKFRPFAAQRKTYVHRTYVR